MAVLSLILALPYQTASASQGNIIRVNPFGNGADGTTWPTAFRTISEAVAQAQSGDRVWVAEGVYRETVHLPKRLGLFGGFPSSASEDDFAQRNPIRFETVVSGANIPASVIQLDAGGVVDGFHLRGGTQAGVFITGEDVILSRCTIRNCVSANGGGMAIVNATAEIVDCTITNNRAGSFGGGVYCVDSTVTMENVIVADNESTNGGGITLGFSSVLMIGCRMLRNDAFVPLNPMGIGGSGGAIRASDSDVVAVNCLFEGNISNNGGLVKDPSDFGSYHFDSCTIIVEPNDIVLTRHKPFIVDNCIVFGAQVLPGGAEITDSWYNVDPLFVDPDNGDFHLKPESPCIDAGTSDGPAEDLDGNPRPVDVPGTGRDGANAFDIGCYEFQEGVLPPNADLDGDGKVDAKDLLMFQRQWSESRK